ncbi:MAG: biotin/lipoyl-binding protein [Chloroflexaceae bacterium]|jgi:biotin carboxyl carrier protein|nr:biotin/lipoyl-binding protein [Chloroflexaceae bacterium]
MSKINVTIDGQSYEVEVDLNQRDGAELTVTVNGEPLKVTIPDPDHPENMEWILIGHRPYEITVDRNLRWIRSFTGMHTLDVRDREATVSRPISGDGRVKAPIPGTVTRVLVEEGQQVEAGQPLVLVEAMKMENEIRATRAGSVSAVHVKAGQDVKLGVMMIEIG